VIIGASPALAALLGFLSLKERPTRRTMFVILVVLLGIGLIFWSDAHAFEATRSQGSPWWGPCFYTRPST
jgi:drug/metabolite transporter (DMT)-like permease